MEIQCQQFGNLITYKTNILHMVEKDCMKKFCESLREHVKNIYNFQKKKMLPLTKEELNSHQVAKVCYICGKIILKNLSKSVNYWNVRDHCH